MVSDTKDTLPNTTPTCATQPLHVQGCKLTIVRPAT